MPLAGLVSGWGGIMTSAAPYLGEFGLPAVVMGNLMQGTSSAALSAYQSVSQNVLSNADTILSQKVANIETVCKMLDTQSDIVRKMLKDDIESNSKEIDNL
jgi:ABC-type molybdate transport system permease subunit